MFRMDGEAASWEAYVFCSMKLLSQRIQQPYGKRPGILWRLVLEDEIDTLTAPVALIYALAAQLPLLCCMGELLLEDCSLKGPKEYQNSHPEEPRHISQTQSKPGLIVECCQHGVRLTQAATPSSPLAHLTKQGWQRKPGPPQLSPELQRPYPQPSEYRSCSPV